MAQRVAISLGLLAGLVLAAAATSGAASNAPARPKPPTSGEVERATKRFLDSENASGAPRAGASGGSGGTGQEQDGGLLAEKRVVAFYGAPQMGATIIGRKSVKGAKRKLRKQARRYKGRGRGVIRGIDLVAVIATSDRGGDGKYRSRQPKGVIRRYQGAASKLDGRLILDIQPGRSTFMKEVRALKEWLGQPNVDIALGPEWNVGRRGRPGRTTGKVKAKTLNKVSRYMNKLVKREDLPQKALVIHQFRSGSIKKRKRIKQRAKVDVTLNFDGIGGASAKRAGYERLTRRNLFAGFSLFYRLDKGLMSPKQVARLQPAVDFVLYQ